MAEKIPPNNQDAEKAVLCCCLISKKAMLTATRDLLAKDFYHPAHEKIFAAIDYLCKLGEPVDIITVANFLTKYNQLAMVGGTEYISKLSDLNAHVANIDHYIDMVSDCSGRRKAIETLDKALTEAYQGSDNLQESIDSVVQSLKANKNNNECTGLINVGEYESTEQDSFYIPTGFESLDFLTDGLSGGMYTVVTGKRGHGKSTLASQLVLTAINSGFPVAFYSGELDVKMFQEWMFCQAAGTENLEKFYGANGAVRYGAKKEVEKKIRRWIKDRLWLYDMKIVKSNEHNTVIDRFTFCAEQLGCKLFFVDNLKTARFKKSSEKDYYRKQAEFANDLRAFALQNNVHVILMAHPNKSLTEDVSDGIAGSSDITDLASNVWRIDRLEGKEQLREGADAVLTVAKNRDCGTLGRILLRYDVPSRRYTSVNGKTKFKYKWEEIKE